jgi:Spy/CpxP family protein refolding chaperone
MREGSRKAYLVIATTFLLGLLVGVVVSPLIWPRRPQPPQGSFQGMVDQLSGELKLTSDQRVQVEKILTETRQQLQDVRKQFGQIRASSRDRISTVLTPEQQQAFELWKQRQDAKRDREHRRGDDPSKPRNYPPGKD